MTRSQDGTTARSTEPREDLKSLRQATEKARDPEVVARLVDPRAWAKFEAKKLVTNWQDWPYYQVRFCRDSLKRADEIIALSPDTLPLIEALEGAEKVMKPFAEIVPHLEKLTGDTTITCDITWEIAFGTDGVLWEQTVEDFRQLAVALTQIRRTLNHD